MKKVLVASISLTSLALLAGARHETSPFSPSSPSWISRLNSVRYQFLSGPQFPMPQAPGAGDNDVSSDVFLSDVISKEQTIGIFSALTRDIDPVSSRFEDTAQNATVLAPSNTAMKSLPRKPWENRGDYESLGINAYSGQSGEDRAHANLRRFVEAHIVPESPWVEGKKVKTLAGNEVWYEKKDSKILIKPGNVEVSSVADKVGNGEVWILQGVLNY